MKGDGTASKGIATICASTTRAQVNRRGVVAISRATVSRAAPPIAARAEIVATPSGWSAWSRARRVALGVCVYFRTGGHGRTTSEDCHTGAGPLTVNLSGPILAL